jgi:hypothetical protein
MAACTRSGAHTQKMLDGGGSPQNEKEAICPRCFSFLSSCVGGLGVSRSAPHPGGGQTLAAKWLVKNKMSREEVAEVLEVHPTRISRWLSGAEKCHEAALYCTVLYLLGEDADELEKIETNELTDQQRERVIVGLRAVELCNAAWAEENAKGAKSGGK